MQIKKIIQNRKYNSGITIIETIVSVAIMLVLFSIVSFSVSALKNNSSIAKNVAMTKAVFEEARYESISGKDNNNYGVKILSDRLVLFPGTAYDSTNVLNKTYLYDNASTTNVSINGDGTQVVYDKIVGSTNNYGTFVVRVANDASKNKTIRILGTGLVSDE